MSPLSGPDTFMSLMWWVAPSRVILTTRFSALPYWFCPRTGMSAPSVYGVAERAEQKRHVVVLTRHDGEGDGRLGEERTAVRVRGELRLGVEGEPYMGGALRRFREVPAP